MRVLSDLTMPLTANVGDPLALVSTPALLIDLDAFERNVRHMAALTLRHGIALRPRARAHKSSAIAATQIEMGAVGICCKKLSEAYPLHQWGFKHSYQQ